MKPEELKILSGIIILAAIAISAPYIIRVLDNNANIANSESYYYLRIFSQGIGTEDQLQQRSIPLNIFYAIGIGNTDMILFAKIAMLILGVITLLLGYAILKNHNMSEKNIWAILLLLIVSPIFIYTFMDFNPYAIIILLNLLVIYLLIKDYEILAALIFFFMPFIDIYGAIISMAFIFLYLLSTYKSLHKHRAFLIITCTSIIAGIIANLLSGYNIFAISPFWKSAIITDIGAEVGFSFSAFILSIIGLVLLWEKGLKNFFIYLSIIGFIILSLFNTLLRIYLNFIILVYAGFAFIYLWRRKWSIQLIKRITILLIICSILFTTLVYTTKLVRSEPNSNYIDALKFLEGQSYPREKIFSSPENGYLIQYYSHRATLVDGKTEIYSSRNMEIFNNITTSRSLERTEELLKESNVRYIFVDTEFMQYLEERQGLMFVIENTNKFEKIYKNPDIEIWMYLG